jgi:hypothetical protein
VVPDSSDTKVDLFSVFVKKFELVSNKMSNYVAEVNFCSHDFLARFGQKMGMPEKYRDFIRMPQKMIKEVNLLDLNPHEESLAVEPFSGRMKVTPDSKKEIELVFEKANLIVFSFLIRFIVELLSIDDIPEHPGFEDHQSVMTFQLRIKEAVACLISGEEACLVMRSRVQ